ncbi:dispanin subfamily A member 2b-like [Bufo bufo]|uniref:dispanin subfamily A member 2b-like n=1 Tax=Bufo bufo TaxID=8384 RepID=UPI001ABE06A6|nr:dispanin subfamily A member 2b-like [Bufo bufo]
MDSGVTYPNISPLPDANVYANTGPDLHKMQPGNVYNASTVVVVQQDNTPVRDDFLWSIFNTIYFNACCLGFVALSYSVKSRDRKLFGDKIGATGYGITARKFNIAATVISALCFIIIIIVNFTARG